MGSLHRFFSENHHALTVCTFNHLKPVSMAFSATLLAIFGAHINDAFKRLMNKRHFILRVLVFIVLCSAGYAALTLFVSRAIFFLLLRIERNYLVAALAGLFLLVGILAERKSHI
jgi:hypothetical protein